MRVVGSGGALCRTKPGCFTTNPPADGPWWHPRTTSTLPCPGGSTPAVLRGRNGETLPTARQAAGLPPGCSQSPAPGASGSLWHRTEILPLSPPPPGPGALPSSQMTLTGRGRESPSPFIAAGEVTWFCIFAPVFQLGKLKQRCWVLHRATRRPSSCSSRGPCPEPSRCRGSGCTPSPGRCPRSPRAASGSWQQAGTPLKQLETPPVRLFVAFSSCPVLLPLPCRPPSQPSSLGATPGRVPVACPVPAPPEQPRTNSTAPGKRRQEPSPAPQTLQGALASGSGGCLENSGKICLCHGSEPLLWLLLQNKQWAFKNTSLYIEAGWIREDPYWGRAGVREEDAEQRSSLLLELQHPGVPGEREQTSELASGSSPGAQRLPGSWRGEVAQKAAAVVLLFL